MLTEVRGKILKCDPNLGIQLTGFTEMGYRPMYSSVARGESDPDHHYIKWFSVLLKKKCISVIEEMAQC